MLLALILSFIFGTFCPSLTRKCMPYCVALLIALAFLLVCLGIGTIVGYGLAWFIEVMSK